MLKFLCGLVIVALARAVWAQADYGLDFVTVGDAGNRASTNEEQILNYSWFPGMGAVDHEFRIMRSPLTATQWVGFVNAYAPFWEGNVNFLLYGTSLRSLSAPGGGYEYSPRPGEEQAVNAVTVQIGMAMCNWLHNGRVNERWAFETGAYDIVGFRQSDFSTWVPPADHEPGARFWIPTLDESVKAAYYDPNKYGEGEEGYWRYPDQGDEPLIEGLPGDGGETIGYAAANPQWSLGTWPVGQYPHVRSYYGVLDISGTYWQWTETSHPRHTRSKLIVGSVSGAAATAGDDRMDSYTLSPPSAPNGLRIATIVPGAPTVFVMCCGLITCAGRTRRDSGR